MNYVLKHPIISVIVAIVLGIIVQQATKTGPLFEVVNLFLAGAFVGLIILLVRAGWRKLSSKPAA